MSLTIPHRFVTGQTIDAGRFNSNSDAISVWSNGVDTSVAALEAVVGAGRGAFFAHAATSQNIPDTVVTQLILGTEIMDKDGWFTGNVFSPLVAGYYMLTASVFFGAAAGFVNVTNTGYLYIRKNAATPVYRGLSSIAGMMMSNSIIVAADGTTDTFDIAASHTGTGNVTYYAAQFSGMYVAAL